MKHNQHVDVYYQARATTNLNSLATAGETKLTWSQNFWFCITQLKTCRMLATMLIHITCPCWQQVST